ncbi:hypothetical protein A3L12_07370 [Thermococcus sp. P6]|uniref:LysO family transporter n=1 Tax=Thermococcus sp. P6 TaxID=122420 RepID=UPI000B59B27E|nr:LysO family transporter [Thermococcus sp. P6]ASJ11130.1 hypothetical protein A3L12_07370 [Thermococcus sp. P6]
MNIFIPLLLGVLIGRIFRQKLRMDLDKPLSATLLLLIFFMGVEAGKVEIDALSLLIVSVTFAALTILGSLAFSLLVGGRR